MSDDRATQGEQVPLTRDMGFVLLHNLRLRMDTARRDKNVSLMLTRMEMAVLNKALEEWQQAAMLREETYWCGCVRSAAWDRCDAHEGLAHDEEPPAQEEG